MVQKNHARRHRLAPTLSGVAGVVLVAFLGVGDEAVAGGGGRRSGVTEECNEAICHVKMTGLTFTPDTLKIRPGATVLWVNSDKVPHTVTSGHPDYDKGTLFDSGASSPILGGAEWNHTFKSAGIVDYFCAFHPRMAGQVVVTGEPIQDVSRLTLMLIVGAAVFGTFGVAAAVHLRKRKEM